MSVSTQDADICCPDCMDEVLANLKLCDLTFTASQVLAVLSSLDVNNASGPDEIPARILKETAHKIAPSLCDLFNKNKPCGFFQVSSPFTFSLISLFQP